MSQPHSDLVRDLGFTAAKVVPPVTVYALTLNEWVAVATLIYLIIQGTLTIWKFTLDLRRRRTVKPEGG